jgi:hypothetical protein
MGEKYVRIGGHNIPKTKLRAYVKHLILGPKKYPDITVFEYKREKLHDALFRSAGFPQISPDTDWSTDAGPRVWARKTDFGRALQEFFDMRAFVCSHCGSALTRQYICYECGHRMGIADFLLNIEHDPRAH